MIRDCSFGIHNEYMVEKRWDGGNGGNDSIGCPWKMSFNWIYIYNLDKVGIRHHESGIHDISITMCVRCCHFFLFFFHFLFQFFVRKRVRAYNMTWYDYVTFWYYYVLLLLFLKWDSDRFTVRWGKCNLWHDLYRDLIATTSSSRTYHVAKRCFLKTLLLATDENKRNANLKWICV